MEDGARSGCGKGFRAQSAPVQGEQFKMLEDLRPGKIGSKRPTLQPRFEARRTRRMILRMYNLFYAEHLKSREQFRRRKFGCSKFTSRQIDVSETAASVFGKDRPKIVVFVRPQKPRSGYCPGS